MQEIRNSKLANFQFGVLLLLLLTSPYYVVAPLFPIFLSSLLFLSIFTSKPKIQMLFQEKTFLYLFIFVMGIYFSFLWSDAEAIFGGNYLVNFYGFLPFLLIIPGLYFSTISTKNIKILIYTSLLAPLVYIFIYYLNHFNITALYSAHYVNDGSFTSTKHFYPDLIANLFIALGAIFLYILAFTKLQNREYKLSIPLFILFLIYIVALFIDDLTVSRIIVLALLIALTTTTFYLFSKRTKYILTGAILLSSLLFLSTSPTFKAGFEELKEIQTTDHFNGSWGVRVDLLLDGVEMYLEHPFFGRGTADVITHIKEIKAHHPKRSNHIYKHFHNDHILILVQVGIVGYFLFLLFIYSLYTLKIEDKPIYLFKQASIVILLVVMFGEHYLQWIGVSAYYATLIGLFLTYKQRELKSPEEPY